MQLYGSPFIGTGRYTDFKRGTDTLARRYADRFHAFDASEIAYRPDANAYDVSEASGPSYSFANPDFSFRQFRSNLVVRWEYRPGSSVYVVWSHGRTDSRDLWEQSFGRNWDSLWDDAPAERVPGQAQLLVLAVARPLRGQLDDAQVFGRDSVDHPVEPGWQIGSSVRDGVLVREAMRDDDDARALPRAAKPEAPDRYPSRSSRVTRGTGFSSKTRGSPRRDLRARHATSPCQTVIRNTSETSHAAGRCSAHARSSGKTPQ